MRKVSVLLLIAVIAGMSPRPAPAQEGVGILYSMHRQFRIPFHSIPNEYFLLHPMNSAGAHCPLNLLTILMSDIAWILRLTCRCLYRHNSTRPEFV